MKITMTAGIFPPDIGGPAKYVPRMAGSLAGKGHSVSVVCQTGTASDPADAAYPFRLVRIHRHGPKPLLFVRTVLAIYRSCRTSDLLYVNGLALQAYLASRLSGVPMVCKVVGDYAWERARNREWFRGDIDAYQVAPKSPRFHLLELIRNLPLRRSIRIIVPSQYLKRLVSGWEGAASQKTIVVYNAVDKDSPGKAAQLAPFAGKTMITVCRLVPWKGVDSLIRVTARLKNVRLLILGDGPLRSRLEALTREAEVAERVLFLGNVPASSVADYLKQSDVFVLNSTYEGFPHVVLEAMAAKVAVVATSAGGTPELVEHGETGLLIPPGDEDALKAALEGILSGSSQGVSLTEKASRNLEANFSWARTEESTERALLDARGSQR